MKAKAFPRFFLAVVIILLIFPNTTVTASSSVNIDAIPTTQQKLQLLSQWGGNTLSVYVQGTYAYIGVGPRLNIIDVSNPVSPQLMGKSELFPGVVESVYVVGTIAYILHPQGLSILDVSNPSSPTVVGFLSISGSVSTGGFGMVVNGNYAYVSVPLSGLNIIDISNPTNPTLAARYSSVSTVRSVYVNRNLAFIASENSGLHILDISDPTNPLEVGSYNTFAYDVYV